MKKKEAQTVNDLIPDDRNYNKGNEKGGALIKKSISKLGAGRSILIDKNNRIIAGNKTVENAIASGLIDLQIVETTGDKIIAVKRTDIDLDSKKGRELALADNATAKANIEWDAEALNEDWSKEELDDWGVVTGFETELEAEEDDYEIPDVIETDIVLGDLFEIGRHRLLCGDSTDSDAVARLMDGEKADITFTSPPYNANAKSSQGSVFNKKKSVKLYSEGYSDNLESDNYIEFARSVLNNCFLFTEGFIFWNVNYNSNSRFEYVKQIYNHIDFLVEQICWKKTAIPYKGCLMRSWEPIYVFSTNKNNIGNDRVISNHWEISNINSQHDNHKACFPIGLPSKAISLNDEFKIVLEPFLGSGSTMVAAHQLNRICYGMELDPKYCQVIIDRMLKIDPSLEIKRNGEKYVNHEKQLKNS